VVVKKNFQLSARKASQPMLIPARNIFLLTKNAALFTMPVQEASRVCRAVAKQEQTACSSTGAACDAAF
jgi:hypothetical protein